MAGSRYFTAARFISIGLIAVGFVPVAQNSTERPPDGGSREVLVSILIPSLPNAPFSAVVNAESIRQLANGTSITLKNHRAIARDRAGRIFQERRLLVPEDGKHESVVTQIEISDPVTHELFICVPKEQVCQVEDFDAPPFQAPKTAAVHGGANLQDLGKQSVGGWRRLGRGRRWLLRLGRLETIVRSRCSASTGIRRS